MELRYLWDTNTVIYYLQQQFPLSAEQFMDNVLQTFPAAISVITELELLCWKTAKENDIEILKSFIRDSVIIELDNEIKQRTVEFRKSFNIKLPDAIIAATASSNNLNLLTRNFSDFRKLPNLEIINPWER